MNAVPPLIGLLESLDRDKDSQEAYVGHCEENGINQERNVQNLRNTLMELLNEVENTRANIDPMYQQINGLNQILKEVDKRLSGTAVDAAKYTFLLGKIGVTIGVSAVDTDWSLAQEKANFFLSSFSTVVSEVDNELAERLMR